jgi:hypothetical protein
MERFETTGDSGGPIATPSILELARGTEVRKSQDMTEEA